MKLIDTHCHLYLKDFKNDRKEMLQRARQAGVERFYLPSIDSGVIEGMLNLEQMFEGSCFPMMGLHPCSVGKNFRDELKIVEAWLEKRPFVAIGEIGLDFYWDKTYTTEQYEAFRYQMELGLKYDLPVVIHSRNAVKESVATVRPFAERGLKGIFHCFGEDAETARQMTDMGFLLGIGGVVTYKKSGLMDTLKEIALDHLVLETDAPYLTPVPFRGKRNEPAYLEYVVKAIATAKGVSEEEVAIATTANAQRLFHPRG